MSVHNRQAKYVNGITQQVAGASFLNRCVGNAPAVQYLPSDKLSRSCSSQASLTLPTEENCHASGARRMAAGKTSRDSSTRARMCPYLFIASPAKLNVLVCMAWYALENELHMSGRMSRRICLHCGGCNAFRKSSMHTCMSLFIAVLVNLPTSCVSR